MNNFDVLKLFQNGTDLGDSVNVGLRLNQMDVTIENLRRRFSGNRGIMQRLNRLENRTRNGGNVALSDRMRGLVRRLTTLEERVLEVVAKLSEDNCESMPCQNGGTCMDIYDSFICKCPENWMGVTCSLDVNECANYAGTDLGCQNGATCSNTQGGYKYDSRIILHCFGIIQLMLYYYY